MGLEMYVYKTKQPVPQSGFVTPDDAVKIAYWRNHSNLHGWMEALYKRKGGTVLFTGTLLKLELTDLDELEKFVIRDPLPHTACYLFEVGEKANDLVFTLIARGALRSGYNVFYDSWWWKG